MFDLGRFDAEATQFHLVVAAAEKFQHAVRSPPGPVTCPVHPLARSGERVGQEPGRGLGGPVAVAAREPCPGQVELTGLCRVQVLVEHVGAHAADRAADRDRAGTVRRRDRMGGGEGRGLGGSVAVADPAVRKCGERAADGTRGEHVAADHELPHRKQGGEAILGELVEQACGQPEGAHLLAMHDLGQQRRFRVVAGQQGKGGPVGQRSPDLEGGRVESQRRGLQEHLVRSEVDVTVGLHQVDHGAVLDRDRAGRAGRTGGVEHVGQVLRPERDRRERGRTTISWTHPALTEEIRSRSKDGNCCLWVRARPESGCVPRIATRLNCLCKAS